MVAKILIPQEIVIFKESDKENWHRELKKEDPFENDYGIISAKVPRYNRQETIEKAIKRPERYFRECCVINAYSPKFEKAYYTHSIHLFYARKWLADQLVPNESFQKELYYDFHNKRYFPPARLKAAQERVLKSNYLIENYPPKLPDVWLVNEYPKSLFIEVKRSREPFKEGQKEGLAIIKKYLECDIRIARVCSEKEADSRLKFEDIDITDIYYEL